jgi:Putative peptidoglycan binding domain
VEVARTTIVEPGDCFYNLSRQEGFHWETLWNHSDNADLRERRKHPNILLPGDQVFVPDLTVKEVARPTDRRHRFVQKGVQARFTVTLLDMGRPRANERYVLTVNGRSKEGCTNANGELTESIPPDAREGILRLGENREEMTIHFGYIDPIEEIRGVQSRLKNLGFYDAAIDDELTPETSAAIAEFQRSINLLADGELSGETRQALVQAHGS